MYSTVDLSYVWLKAEDKRLWQKSGFERCALGYLCNALQILTSPPRFLRHMEIHQDVLLCDSDGLKGLNCSKVSGNHEKWHNCI